MPDSPDLTRAFGYAVNRLDIDTGRRVTVVGVLRVIDHGPHVVNRVLVPACVEIRIESR